MRGPLCLVNTSPLITVEYLLAISSVTGFINFEACLWSAICFQSMIAAFFHAGSTSISRFTFWDPVLTRFSRLDCDCQDWLAKNSLRSRDINRFLFGHLNFLLVHFWFPELQRIRKKRKNGRVATLKTYILILFFEVSVSELILYLILWCLK